MTLSALLFAAFRTNRISTATSYAEVPATMSALPRSSEQWWLAGCRGPSERPYSYQSTATRRSRIERRHLGQLRRVERPRRV